MTKEETAGMWVKFNALNVELRDALAVVKALDERVSGLYADLCEVDPSHRFLSKYIWADWVEGNTFTFESLVSDYKEISVEVVSGFIRRTDYRKFLQTPYWKLIAAHVKEVKGHRCCACPATDGLDVHHRTYENHGREIETWETDLNPFCRACHEKFHAGNGTPSKVEVPEPSPQREGDLTNEEITRYLEPEPPPKRRFGSKNPVELQKLLASLNGRKKRRPIDPDGALAD